MKTAGIYARVSTHDGQNPEMQLQEIRDYCHRRDWTIGREYADKGISGAKERRPALDQLLSDCKKRVVDCVVVYRYDRVARSLRQLANALEDFRALGIDFVSLHEGVDTFTPNGRLVFGQRGSVRLQVIVDQPVNMLASMAALHGRGTVVIPAIPIEACGGERSFRMNLATAVFHAVADLALANIQADVNT